MFISEFNRRQYETDNPQNSRNLHACILLYVTGYVMENLISRDVLHKPDSEKPFTDGVFYVEGEYIGC